MSLTSAAQRLMVFLFNDLVDSTDWKNRLGDAKYVRAVLKPHNDLFCELLARFPGASEKNDMGDGFLAVFPSPSDAGEFSAPHLDGM